MRAHSTDIRAAAMAALLIGNSPGQVSKQFNLPLSTVKTWKRQGLQHKTLGEDFQRRVVSLLRSAIESMTEQAQLFRDPEWLAKQDAGDITLIHGIMADKAFRMVAALDL